MLGTDAPQAVNRAEAGQEVAPTREESGKEVQTGSKDLHAFTAVCYHKSHESVCREL